MDLALDQRFSEPSWRKRTFGGGTVTVANGIVTADSVLGDSSMMECYVPVVPGQAVEVEVFGRLLSGQGGGVYLDAVNHNGSLSLSPESVRVTSADWQRYRASYRIPLKGGQPTFVRVGVGVPSTLAGSAQFHSPIVRTTDGIGAPLVLARGLLRVEGGVASMHPNFPSHGIASVSRSATDTVTVTLDHELPSSPANVRALIQATGSPEQMSVPVAGQITAGAAPTFLVKWSNGTAAQNITAGNWYAALEVTL